MSGKPLSSDKFSELLGALYESSGAARFDISFEQFSRLLLRIEASYPGAGARGCELYRSLQIEDLVLAHACAEGNDAAWEHFVARYRTMMHSAALVLCRDELSARDVVTLLWGDLFGTAVDGSGKRRSKLASYMGRGTLASWLRATLAQACIDQSRLQRRFINLNEALPLLSRELSVPDTPARADPRLSRAVEQAIAALRPENRLLLKAYYFDQMTLMEIGALLGVHQSTISRRLAGIARQLRRSILQSLVKQGMSLSAARQTLKSDVRYLSVDIEGTLIKVV